MVESWRIFMYKNCIQIWGDDNFLMILFDDDKYLKIFIETKKIF